MELKSFLFQPGPVRKKGTQTFLAMRMLLLFITLFFISGTAVSQSIRLSVQEAPLDVVFKEIQKQTDYRFIYTSEQVNRARRVTLQLNTASLEQVLAACFQDQPLTYIITGKHIVVKDKVAVLTGALSLEVTGNVTDEKGAPIQGSTVLVKGTNNATATNDRGGFRLRNVQPDDLLLVSAVGHRPTEVPVQGRTRIDAVLAISVTTLDETVLIAYGATTKRFNTGNVSKVSSADIEKQPVGNALAALQGRVPGMVVTQTSGVPGSGFNIEIRGRTSLDLRLSANHPLFLVDGVPFEPGNVAMDQLTSAARNPLSTSQGGLSPLSFLSPADIETIEVLKDADATAIYGSRGANGVVLITTKKGKAGKTRVSLDYQQGWSHVTRTMDLLRTSEYVQMRREGFQNDGVIPTPSNAPDILLWDTTRYTDLKKLLIGNSAGQLNVSASLSGGTNNTRFLLKAGYFRETNVFLRELSFNRGSFLFNINHQSADQRFTVFFQSSFSTTKNNLITTDLTRYINLPPHLLLYDSLGNLAWREKGVNFSSVNSIINPLAELLKKYAAKNDNLNGNLSLQYKFFQNLTAKFTMGYNSNVLDENSSIPKAAIASNQSTLASAKFANANARNWMIEPQLDYTHYFSGARLNVLLGGSWQETVASGTTINGTNYSNDLLLNSIAAAGTISSSNQYSQYRYAAVFGRINYRLHDRYLLNLSARRDGSTRFGPTQRFSNFGAVGAGWIFSAEPGIGKKLSFLSYGKIRASYGLTGNDQIGDYRYLDLWNNTASTYQSVPGFVPSSIFNPDYEWEVNKKLEAGLELGFLKDRLFFSASYYRNRSSNQLVSYRLPGQTGFLNMTKNLPALVQNTGLEIVLEYKTAASKKLVWASAFTITVARNKLVSFPGLATSTYNSSFLEGSSLSTVKAYRYLGVDPLTGIYSFEDVNKDGQLKSADDYFILGNVDPKYYGGWQNTFQFNNIELGFFIQFTKQVGGNYLREFAANPPGSVSNQPLLVWKRWQNPGELAPVQRFSATNASGASITSRSLLQTSSAIYSDASFARLKNVSLTYTFPQSWTRKLQLEEARLFINAQNLLTITRYEGSDPETQNFYRLPPLRTIVAGIHFGF